MERTKGAHALDLVGQRFGKWKVLAKYPKRAKNGWVLWECKCSGCGTTHLIGTGNLRSKATTQCQACAYKPGNRKAWHGHKIEYKSESLTRGEWAKKLGLTKESLCGRLYSRRWDIDRALSTPKIPMGQGACKQKITANGETHTIPEWAKKLGISRQAVYERIEKGMPPEQAVTLGRQPGGGNKNSGRKKLRYLINGKEQTILELAEQLGLTYGGMVARLCKFALDDPRLLAPRHSGHTGRPRKNNKKEN